MRHPLLAWLGFVVLFLVGGFFVPPGAVHAEDPPAEDAEDGDGYEGDTKESADLFDEGEALREQGLLSQAVAKYWDAFAADFQNYRAYVQYARASLEVEDDLDRLVEDLGTISIDYPTLKPLMDLHLLRIQNRPAARLETLEALTKSDSENVNAWLELGRAYLATDEAKKAEAALAKAMVIAPSGRPDILLLRVEALLALEKIEDARSQLEGAVAAKPDWAPGHLMLARMAFAAENYEEVGKRTELVLALRPGTLGALLLKAESLDRTEKSDAALEILAQARRVSEDAPAAAVAYADLLARTPEGLEGAAGVYKIALEKDDENIHALYGLAWTLERLEKYEEAEEQYRSVLALDPTHMFAVNSVGLCLFRQGRVSQAQVQFKRALDMDPKFVLAELNLGATYDVQAKYGDAIKIYEKILKRREHKENLRAMINCAFDYEALGSFNKALKLLEKAHKVLPEDSQICTWIGDNQYFQKKWKKATEWYKKATALDEENFFAWRGLGYAFGQRKDWDDSIMALRRASALNPEDLDVHLALGDILFNEKEDLEGALASFKAYVAAGGDDPAVPELITEIEAELAAK